MIAAILGLGLLSFLISWIATFAMILVAEISLKLNWLPATGARSFSSAPVDAIRHALLPAIAIAM